jgi:hypothetical protein
MWRSVLHRFLAYLLRDAVVGLSRWALCLGEEASDFLNPLTKHYYSSRKIDREREICWLVQLPTKTWCWSEVREVRWCLMVKVKNIIVWGVPKLGARPMVPIFYLISIYLYYKYMQKINFYWHHAVSSLYATFFFLLKNQEIFQTLF